LFFSNEDSGTNLYLAVLLELSGAEKAVVNRHLVIAEIEKTSFKDDLADCDWSTMKR